MQSGLTRTHQSQSRVQTFPGNTPEPPQRLPQTPPHKGYPTPPQRLPHTPTKATPHPPQRLSQTPPPTKAIPDPPPTKANQTPPQTKSYPRRPQRLCLFPVPSTGGG